MNNPLANWWRSQKFNEALKSQNNRLAKQLLKEIQNSGAKLSWQQKLFKEHLQLEKLLQPHTKEGLSIQVSLMVQLGDHGIWRIERREEREKE